MSGLFVASLRIELNPNNISSIGNMVFHNASSPTGGPKLISSGS
jgi:hypothetical protein